MDVDAHAKDGACVNEALGEEQENGVRDDACRCYDEACCGESDACDEHGDGGVDLDIGTSIFCHMRVGLMSVAKVNYIVLLQKDIIGDYLS